MDDEVVGGVRDVGEGEGDGRCGGAGLDEAVEESGIEAGAVAISPGVVGGPGEGEGGGGASAVDDLGVVGGDDVGLGAGGVVPGGEGAGVVPAHLGDESGDGEGRDGVGGVEVGGEVDADGVGEGGWGAGVAGGEVTGGDFPGVGGAVAVGVGGVWIEGGGLGEFEAVEEAVGVGVGDEGIGGGFLIVFEAVGVGVGEAGFGAEDELLVIGEGVFVGVECGIGGIGIAEAVVFLPVAGEAIGVGIGHAGGVDFEGERVEGDASVGVRGVGAFDLEDVGASDEGGSGGFDDEGGCVGEGLGAEEGAIDADGEGMSAEAFAARKPAAGHVGDEANAGGGEGLGGREVKAEEGDGGAGGEVFFEVGDGFV